MIFKIHYGLWYGGLVGIIPFMFVYATQYCDANGSEQGVLFTILPFVALIAKPIAGGLADRFNAHRRFLLLFIFCAMLGYGSLAIYPFLNLAKSTLWALYCISALVGNTSMCVVNSLGDSLAINSCTRKGVSYGSYRLWGPVGFGIFGAIWGFSNRIGSLPEYVPGIITMIVVLSINSIILATWREVEEFQILSTTDNEPASPVETLQNTEPSNETEETGTDQVVAMSQRIKRLRVLWRLVREQKSIFFYIFLFTFCGLLTGIHWQFFIQYVSQVAKQEYNTVVALALPVQSLGGELIFFMLSSKILDAIGASLTLVVCLLSFAVRYLLYAYVIPVVNIYWILPVELLQGPAFGLMYSVLTHQANMYSQKVDEMIANGNYSGDTRLKNSLHATLQGILGASFEGLGLGLGALVGGLALDVSHTLMWQIAGFSALIVAPFAHLINQQWG